MKEEERIKISVNQEDVQNIIDCYEKDFKYIKKLENNWNELKEWLEEYLKLFDNPDSYEEQKIEDLKEVLSKMQEIESRK